MKLKYYKTILLLAVTLLITVPGFSQTKEYSYSYDDSGNRIQRKCIELKSGSISRNNHGEQIKKEFEDLVNGQEIKIYPNPTKGMLKIEIPDLKENNARLMVFNNQGQLIKEIKVNSNFSEINLSNHPSGMYILKILIGQNSSEWKIIKE